MKTKEKTLAELREFGEVMALAALIFSAVGIWKRSAFSVSVLVCLLLATGFLLFAFFAPARLRRLETKWMVFAEKLGMVVTFVVMLITFFGVMTPIGLLLRLMGKDLLGRKIDRKSQTYWAVVEKDGPSGRHFLPY